MFGTEDEYTKAVRGASIHAHEEESRLKSTIGSLLLLSVLATAGYFGFNYYSESKVNSTTTKSLLAQVSEQRVFSELSETKPTAVMGVSHTNVVEDEYLIALNNMEVDILGEASKKTRENSESDTNVQESLSAAMSSIIEDAMSADDSRYTQEITKEIKGDDVAKSRVVVVKKGDTLVSLSNKFYGDGMKYGKIIASNNDVINNESKIYVGQKIRLPY